MKLDNVRKVTVTATAGLMSGDHSPVVVWQDEHGETLITADQADVIAGMLTRAAANARGLSAALGCRPLALASLLANRTGGSA